MTSNSQQFLALPGFYQLLFMYLEPVSTALPSVIIWLSGASWFHHELIPSTLPTPPAGFLDDKTLMMVWQLGNCYLLLSMLSSFVFRAVRDALPDNPVAQERILGASLLAMAIADITHILVTVVGLPSEIRYDFFSWNAMTHGNITSVVVLLAVRIAWFLGIGRKRYYFGVTQKTVKRA